MDFGLNEEQRMIVDTTRAFVEAELYPHEQAVERTGVLEQAIQVRIQEGDPPGVDPESLPDPVAHQEPGVEHRDHSLCTGDQATVHPHVHVDVSWILQVVVAARHGGFYCDAGGNAGARITG